MNAGPRSVEERAVDWLKALQDPADPTRAAFVKWLKISRLVHVREVIAASQFDALLTGRTTRC